MGARLMSIHITMSIPTLSRYNMLLKVIDNIASGTRKPDIMMVIDNGGNLQEWMGSRKFPIPVKVLVPGSNIGVGPACNLAWSISRQYYLHSNDDVEFPPDFIQTVAEAAEAQPEVDFFWTFNQEGPTMTVFLATRRMFELTQGFDEQFVPAYFEDNDLGRRMILQNINRVYLDKARYHHYTSSTLKAFNEVEMQLHHQRFAANEQRYIDKWGGHADVDEKWDIPYNGAKGHTKEHPELWAKPEIKEGGYSGWL